MLGPFPNQLPWTDNRKEQNKQSAPTQAFLQYMSGLDSSLRNPVPWTPVDASGAGLTFTGVSVSSMIMGSLVFAYGRLTYPVTASGAGAAIGGLPAPAANQNYVRNANVALRTDGVVAFAVPIGGLAIFNIVNSAGVGQTNAQLSGLTITFIVIYPLV